MVVGLTLAEEVMTDKSDLGAGGGGLSLFVLESLRDIERVVTLYALTEK